MNSELILIYRFYFYYNLQIYVRSMYKVFGSDQLFEAKIHLNLIIGYVEDSH